MTTSRRLAALPLLLIALRLSLLKGRSRSPSSFSRSR